MATQTSRRGFLRGVSLRDDSRAIRPPGAHPARFAELCTDCDLCVSECPENILSIDATGRPVLDPASGSCTFCGLCAEACPTGALSPDRIADWPWRAQVAPSCLSLNGVSCRSCQDACEADAIRFRLQIGGRAQPVLDTDACTGCGACASVCPAGAISLVRPKLQQREPAP
ncbi:MAG: ferredoxin-type protein NapF [Rhodobacteraceae bacterium]|nr:ferredoxin-type protein NapF [Paracoccaceae bacterium]